MKSDSSSVVGANLLKLLSVKDVFLRIKKEFRNNFLKQHLQHTASAAFQQIIKDFSFRNKAPGFTHLPCKILLGGISLMSTEFLLKFHEIEMLKRGRIYKFLKRKLERKLVS